MIDNDMTVEILKEALVLAAFLWTPTNRWGQFGRCAKNFALEGILEDLLQGFGSVVAIRCTATRVLDGGVVQSRHLTGLVDWRRNIRTQPIGTNWYGKAARAGRTS
jgi:hypothetical protein